MNARNAVRVAALILVLSVLLNEAQYGYAEKHEPGVHAEEKSAVAEDHLDRGPVGDIHEDEGQELHLTARQRERFGIAVRTAGPGSLQNEMSLPGEILFNEDRIVHVVPRVAGISREISMTVGDTVEAGELMAVIDSRELADAKAEYLAARARAGLASTTASREKALWRKQISSERDFLEAQQALSEAEIELRSAGQKLHALGLSEAVVTSLGGEGGQSITSYEIRSPIRGIVTEKHIALGESLGADTHIFTIVDTRDVWVNLTVYTKDLPAIRRGQVVLLRVDHSGAQARGTVAMVTPFVEESTRSATARIVLDNGDGRWVPGTFVTGSIQVSEEHLPVVVPRSAVQHIEGRDVVFTTHGDGFEISPVTTGRVDHENVEVVAGLTPGTTYVAEGAFELKATVITRNLGSHAGHGH